MAITRASQSTVKQGLDKNKNFVAGIPPILGRYYLMGSVTVGSGGASSIEFTDIPPIYKHLQIRTICKDAGNFGSYYNLRARFNSDSGSNYARHALDGNGSSVSSYGLASESSAGVGHVINNSSGQTSCFSANIIDILDYCNTSKTKTVRALNGSDWNTGGGIRIKSSLWNNTSAISSILFFSDSNSNLIQHTNICLYGIGRVS